MTNHTTTAMILSSSDALLAMSTREIAELTKKDHANVLRDARNMLEELGKDAFSFEGIYLDAYGREKPCINLPKDLTFTLVAGYSAKMRHAIVVRWQELEAQAAQPPVALTRMDILKLAMESEQARIQAEAERDHAIATKAQIGDKKVATAMATASAKAREVARLKHELGYSARNATILQVERKLGREFDFHPLRRWCNLNKVAPDTVPDKRYPNGVKAWPAGAWANVYGVDLAELFGEVAA